jgi:hypothetical protein
LQANENEFVIATGRLRRLRADVVEDDDPLWYLGAREELVLEGENGGPPSVCRSIDSR